MYAKRHEDTGLSLLKLLYFAGLVAFVAYCVQLDQQVAPGFPTEVSLSDSNIAMGLLLILLVVTKGGVGISCLMLFAIHFLNLIHGDAPRSMGFQVAQALLYVGALSLFPAVMIGNAVWPSVWAYLRGNEPRSSRPQETAQRRVASVANKATSTGKKTVVNPRAFDNLVGVDKAIQEFKDALELPIVHPELMKQYNIEPTRGIILYGPPGTGKTSLARAVAEYFNVPFVYQKASAFSGRYVGTTEGNVRSLFQEARSLAQEKGSRVIIFLDEIDAIARKRDGGHLNRPSDLILPALLEELDGFKKDSSIFLIAATNRLDVLDEAILRPGRLDKRIEVGYPDLDARNKLFRLYLKGVPLCEGDEIEANFDAIMDECAQRHERISPADIKEICQRVKVKAATRQAQIGPVGIRAEDLRREMAAWVPAGAG